MKRTRMSISRLTYSIIFAVMIVVSSTCVSAQSFTIESFKPLPNDVTAFINPVNDLNDTGCGLIKVPGTNDFVFATPLGVVKRVDKVGEIWLYVPKGTKKITVKHAQWGVLRDYMLPEKIDSHMSYELRINAPESAISVLTAEPIVKSTTITDTLILTRVDTLMLSVPAKVVPFEMNVLATIAYGGRTACMSGGVLLMAMKRNGGFVHVSTDFGHCGAVSATCDKDGNIDGAVPFYSGHKKHAIFMINAGGAHRIAEFMTVFEGIGYSAVNTSWQLAPSEGGGYVKNSYYSVKGISFEVGLMAKFKNVRVSASVVNVKGRDWYGSVGIGIKLG